MPEFLKRIKTRIALIFSLLFLMVAIPAIIYVFHQVNLFFEGMYLRQMRVAAQTARTLYDSDRFVSADSLTSSLSNITSSSVFLISADGAILSASLEDNEAGTAGALSSPILPGGEKAVIDGIRHQFVKIDGRRYLKVQAGLGEGIRLLQVKSFARVTQLMARMREVIFWSSFLGLIALIAVAFWVSAKITGPLEELTRWAQQIRGGQLAEKSSIKSPDEVGDLVGALNDIVDYLNLARLRLSRLETMRGDFFAIVRRELEPSVLALQNRVEGISKISPAEDKISRGQIEALAVETANLKRIVNELMALSDIESGKHSLDPRAFPLIDVLNEIAVRIKERISIDAFRLEFECPDATQKVSVVADRALMRIALENLITNAIEANPPGIIIIGCHHERNGVRIAVEGAGPGQDAGHPSESNMTSPGIDSSHESNRSELGLAIAMYIIEAHGQRLFIESAPGTGSRYSFWLPLAPY